MIGRRSCWSAEFKRYARIGTALPFRRSQVFKTYNPTSELIERRQQFLLTLILPFFYFKTIRSKIRACLQWKCIVFFS